MEIKVLGDPNEKGKSFESIMATVLNELGYTEIRNRTKPSGMELDLLAVHKIKGTRILCECKAHDKAIESEEIRKFLGTLTLQVGGNHIDEGLFFSTSGFHSNVHYMMDHGGDPPKKMLTLYDTEMIIDLFRQVKLLTTDNEIDKVIKNNTSYQLGKRYLVIYQSALYVVQLLALEGEVTSYIILKGMGYSVSIPIMDKISELDDTLKPLTRLDLEITRKVTLSLLDLKSKTINDISSEIQETVHGVSVALGDMQLQKIVIEHGDRFTINLDFPSLTIITEKFVTDVSKFDFMGSAYIETIINDKFADYVTSRFYLPTVEKQFLVKSAKVFPSVLRFLLSGSTTTYHNFYNARQPLMSHPDAQEFDDMITGIFLKTVYEEMLNDLHHTPPSYLKQKHIHGYNNKFDLKFGSESDLLFGISGDMHTYIVNKEPGEISAGQILAPVDMSSNLALGNHLLGLREYPAAVKTYAIIIKNSQDVELLWQAWNNISQAFRMMGHHDEELRCLNKSLEYKISSEALSNKILCLEAMNSSSDEINRIRRQLDDLESNS